MCEGINPEINPPEKVGNKKEICIFSMKIPCCEKSVGTGTEGCTGNPRFS